MKNLYKESRESYDLLYKEYLELLNKTKISDVVNGFQSKIEEMEEKSKLDLEYLNKELVNQDKTIEKLKKKKIKTY